MNENIIIVEDVDDKYNEVFRVVKSVFPTSIISRSSNLNDAEEAIDSWESGILLLDISMDITSSGFLDYNSGHATMGGLDILERMSLLKVGIPTILVTGFDSFQDQDRFDGAMMNLDDVGSVAADWIGQNYIGYVRYGVEGWNETLKSYLESWRGR